MKTCRSCGKLKELDDFYTHPHMADGRLNKCKDCVRLRVRINRQANVEYYRRFDQIRASDPARVEARKQYDKRVPEVGRKAKAKWGACNKNKKRVHKITQMAIDSGQLTRQPCFLCDAEPGYAHHSDYDQPLLVTWVCAKHHSMIHFFMREAAKQAVSNR